MKGKNNHYKISGFQLTKFETLKDAKDFIRSMDADEFESLSNFFKNKVGIFHFVNHQLISLTPVRLTNSGKVIFKKTTKFSYNVSLLNK